MLVSLLRQAGPGAHPFPSCARPAARGARPAARSERALRLHAARLLRRSVRNTIWSPRTAAIAASPTRRGVLHASAAGPSQWGLDITAWRATFACISARCRVACSRRRATSRSASPRYFPDVDNRGPAARRNACGAHRGSCASLTLGQTLAGEGSARRRRVRRRRACARAAAVVSGPRRRRPSPLPQWPRCGAVDARAIRGRGAAGADRCRTTRRDLVSGAGARIVFVHAVGRARLGRCHRRFGAGGAARAAGGPSARDAGPGRCDVPPNGTTRCSRRAVRSHAARASADRDRRLMTDPQRYLAIYLARAAGRTARNAASRAALLDAKHFYLAGRQARGAAALAAAAVRRRGRMRQRGSATGTEAPGRGVRGRSRMVPRTA